MSRLWTAFTSTAAIVGTVELHATLVGAQFDLFDSIFVLSNSASRCVMPMRISNACYWVKLQMAYK